MLRTLVLTGMWTLPRNIFRSSFGWWFRGSLRSHLNHRDRDRKAGKPGSSDDPRPPYPA